MSKNEGKRKLFPHQRAFYGPRGPASWLQPPSCNFLPWGRPVSTHIPLNKVQDNDSHQWQHKCRVENQRTPESFSLCHLMMPSASYTLICWPGFHLQTYKVTTTHYSKVKKTGEIVAIWNFYSVRNYNIFMSAERKGNLKRFVQNWSHENFLWQCYILITCRCSLKTLKWSKRNKI